jgi:uncharacterized protein YjbJ (UPF0337 family)
MVDESRIEGATKKFGGKVQDAVGGLTGDTETQAHGARNQATGAARNASVRPWTRRAAAWPR